MSAQPGPEVAAAHGPGASGGPSAAWQRLHPLTPVVAAGRTALLAGVVALEDRAQSQGSSLVLMGVLGGVAVLNLVISAVRYLVTRWSVGTGALRIETGLFTRDARQLPLARIQAVDVVRPFLARAFGLAELRVRLAGSSRSEGRLAYLSERVALELRASLLAGHHGLDLSTPEPVESPVTAVPLGRLIGSTVLSGAMFLVVALALVGTFLLSRSAAARGAYFGTVAVYLFGFLRRAWQRVAEQYGFTIGLAPDGIRVRRGLLSTVSETVPLARVQAVRKVQPMAWRPFGWCRLEVDVAGSPGKEQGTRSSKVTKSLLPVGPGLLADSLLVSLLGLHQFELGRPPGRARLKAPFSYHFLAAGAQGALVASSVGRLRKVTTWVPLEKVQSVRHVQGPVQRALRLSTVHLDAAGRRLRVQFRDQDEAEARQLFEALVVACRQARRSASIAAARPAVGGDGAPGGTGAGRTGGAPAGPASPLTTGQPAPPVAHDAGPAHDRT